MKIICDYCGSIIDEDNEVCPNCGGTLDGVHRFAGEQPQTIEELKEWYIARNLPPEEVTRFFIGKDIREARAFGIYQDSAGDFVVYKNKANGERAIRYQGMDEAYAVNELYQKLKGEIADRKSESVKIVYQESARDITEQKKANTSGKMAGLYGVIAIIPAIVMFSLAGKDAGPTRGYYQYQDDTYYYQNDSWYYYDDESDDWSYISESEVPEEVTSEDCEEYQIYSHDGTRFEDSIWYTEDTYSDYEDDWDDDYDWDSGSDWDSGGTDWDSDW